MQEKRGEGQENRSKKKKKKSWLPHRAAVWHLLVRRRVRRGHRPHVPACALAELVGIELEHVLLPVAQGLSHELAAVQGHVLQLQGLLAVMGHVLQGHHLPPSLVTCQDCED